MKKILFAVVVILVALPPIGFSGENYLQARYGEEFDSNHYENYFILENKGLENWALGTRIVVVNNGFTVLNPHLFWKKYAPFQFGAKYCHTSIGSESIGPAFRFIKTMGPVFVFFDSAYYFDSKGNNNKLDTWLHVSTSNKKGWYYGAEIWYYSFSNSTENLNFRPLKIGYRFADLPSPFIMLERKWVEWKDTTNSIYCGIELNF